MQKVLETILSLFHVFEICIICFDKAVATVKPKELLQISAALSAAGTDGPSHKGHCPADEAGTFP